MEEQNNVIDEVLSIFKNDWNKQVILYGPPGTSKTYSSTIIAAKFLAEKNGRVNLDDLNYIKNAEEYLEKCKKSNKYKIVQFHPSYTYEDFVRGITFDSTGQGAKYKVESKILEKFCEGCDENNPKVLVIDEINRAPLGSVLGELIYALEYRDQAITTSYEKDGKSEIIIPKGLYIIGTMNTADRSIGSMDYAVRRRFAFVKVPSNREKIKSSWGDLDVGEKALNLYDALMSEKGIFADDLLSDKDMDVEDIKIGHTYFLGQGDKENDKDTLLKYLAFRLRYQIFPIYQEYMKDGLIDIKKGKERFDEILKQKDFKELNW